MSIVRFSEKKEEPQRNKKKDGFNPLDFFQAKDEKQKKQPDGTEKKPPKGFGFYWIYVAVAMFLLVSYFFNNNYAIKKTSWQKFANEMFIQGDVEKIVVVTRELVVNVYIKQDKMQQEKYADINKDMTNSGPHYYFNIGTIETFENKIADLQAKYTQEEVPISYDNTEDWTKEVLGWLIPIGLIILFWVFIMKRMAGPNGPGGQIFNVGKSKATLFDKNMHVKVDFNDVAGLEEAKVEVMEIVEFLKQPDKYTKLGAKIPKGALLVGPPGTGKTLLARAMAGEAKVPFFSISGSDFVEMFVGVGASRVRDLFRQAKEKAPCIVFIDEIDAIGRARGKSAIQGGNDERENTLNQLLSEMDGFAVNNGVIIIAATNRVDVLDSALLRPGRFDRQIHVELPDLKERFAIFKVHLKPVKISKDIDVDFLARQTPGFSGADIANVCNEAALIGARKGKTEIEKQDFLDAIDRIIAGLEKKNKIITTGEKRTIAYHEAGHATVSWLVEFAAPLVKVTIIPRGKSLGAAWYLPDERQITTKDQLLDQMCATLAGRAAEEIIFGKLSTGALNDLERVSKQAYAMVVFYGLNEKIGNVSYFDSSGQSEYNFTKPYSEETAKMIDVEIKKIIDIQYDRAKSLLVDNKEKLTQLAELLLEKEVIFRENLEQIFGKRSYHDETPNLNDTETVDSDGNKDEKNDKQDEPAKE